MGHTMYLPALYNWLQKGGKVYKFTAITGRKTVRHFDALIFFSGGQMKFLCVIYAHMCVNGNTGPV